ncbi:hypothetical protein JD844_011154, partial [Phrynosoma platyrhinos]
FFFCVEFDRVKLEEVIREYSYDKITNGFSNVSKKQRKRHRQKSETNYSESDYEEHRKRKRSKPHSKHSSSQEENPANIWDSATRTKRKKAVAELDCITGGKSDDNTHSKKLKKRDQREKEQETETHRKKKKARTLEEKNILQKTKKTFPLSSKKKLTAKNTIARSGTKNGGSSSESSTSSSTSDDSTADTKQKQTLTTKVASQHINKSQLASPVTSVSPGKVTTKERNSLERAKRKKAKSQSSSSGSDSTSGEEEIQQSGNLKNKLSYNNKGTGSDVTSKNKAKTSSSESESSESETYVIKKPKMNAIVSQSLGGTGNQQVIPATCGLSTGSSDNIRGRGRGDSPFWRGPRVRGCRGMFRGRGRGRGESTNSFYNYTSEHQKEQQLNEAATNTSVIIQNPVEIQKKDYSILPLLAAPPQVGQKIAFKLLELTENYTPEVSDYKEGKIVSWNPANKQLELEILSFSSGKFDLVYQSADGAETVEYAITESWDALIEPRLIVDSPNNESSTINGSPSNVKKQVPCINSL